MKGIIFDFNGTMFQDSDLHEQAWINILEKYTGQTLSQEDIVKNIHGKVNTVILRHFIDKNLTDEEVAALSDEKESIYRNLVESSPQHQKLTTGLLETLAVLKEQKIPMTIASASPQVNMDYYFKKFDLTRWFDPQKVVVDNGTFPGKPAPDIFLIAAKKLGLSPADCLVLEDSYSGLQAAHNAGIGTVVAIDPDHHNRALFTAENLAPDGIIENFTGFVEKYL